MAAGLGFKTFTTGEVLTAADTNGYLMQGVLVFASAAARDAAITSPQEGQFAYLKDTNVTTYYTGSAWANLDTTGMTNPMTTTGDVIYSSPGSTPVRLGIGSAGNVLTVSGGVPVWSAPAGGGKVLQVVAAYYTTAIQTSSSTFTDTGLTVNITPTLNTSKVLVIVQANGLGKFSSSAAGVGLRLLRGASVISFFEELAGYSAANDNDIGGSGTVYLDSPATTSATTYKLQYNNYTNASGTARMNRAGSGTQSSIVVMEIGA